jgi:hypothetical protein
MADDAEIFRPPRHISKKVPKTGGPRPDEAILRALNAAEDLMEQYQGWAVDDLTLLWRRFKELEHEESRELAASEILDMFNISHEIRGQGGTFGFPLISLIGDSLCKFLEDRKQLSLIELEIIRVHVLAMKAVFRQELRGPQTPLRRDLNDLLQLLRTKVDLSSRFGQGDEPIDDEND